MKTKVEEFREHMPLIQTLFNPGMRQRHWQQLSDVVGFPMQPTPESNLSKFLEMNLDQYIQKFDQISEAATKEFGLEKALNKMKEEWRPVFLLFLLLDFSSLLVLLICLFFSYPSN